MKNRWHYANSSHTVDLIRYFGGDVQEVNSYGVSRTRREGDNFVSSFSFKNGSIGTYCAYWNSPGGWSVTLYSEKISVTFRPLEQGFFSDRSFVEKVLVPSKEDVQYKVGFYAQMRDFLHLIEFGELSGGGIDLKGAVKTLKLTDQILQLSK